DDPLVRRQDVPRCALLDEHRMREVTAVDRRHRLRNGRLGELLLAGLGLSCVSRCEQDDVADLRLESHNDLPGSQPTVRPVPLQTMADLVIRNGTVVDGTGAPRRRADVAIEGERIVAIGDEVAGTGATTIDADGLVVTPGWVDLHTHYDGQVTW